MADEHGWQAYNRGCRCAVCREGVRVRVAQRRAQRRGLTPVPSLPAEPNPMDTVVGGDVLNGRAEPGQKRLEPGPCVLAVRADLESLGDLTGHQVLAACATALARVLDSGQNLPSWPSAVKQLTAVMDMLHAQAAPRPGRLAAVQKLSDR
jgi:hypothetical protein